MYLHVFTKHENLNFQRDVAMGFVFNISNTGELLLVLTWDFFFFSVCLLTLFFGIFFSTITYPLWQLYASHHTLALEILPYFSPER